MLCTCCFQRAQHRHIGVAATSHRRPGILRACASEGAQLVSLLSDQQQKVHSNFWTAIPNNCNVLLKQELSKTPALELLSFNC